MTLWQFIGEHPWWTLVFLVIILSFLDSIAGRLQRGGKA